MIRVVLPFHLQSLAMSDAEVDLYVDGPATLHSVLDALESRFPMLRGAIRDPATRLRRPLLRFYACRQDISHLPPGAPLPEPVASGAEPLLIVGAISGG